jgi:hypothetical protein
MIRLIVSGSRYAGEEHVEFIGSRLRPICRRDLGVLAHGDADGVDRIAARLAVTWGWQVKPIPARWDECDLTVPETRGGCPDWPHRKPRRDGSMYCPRAGWRRNQALVDLSPLADFIVAFPDQRKDSGTRDFLRRAKRAGYTPRVYPIKVVIPDGRR